MLKKLILVALILGVVTVLGAALVMDRATQRVVERQATSALGVETKLGSAKVRPFGGRLLIENLTVANPEGFQSERLLVVGEGSMAVDLRSLLSDEVHTRRLELSGVELAIERTAAGTNYGAVLENLQRSGSSGTEGKRFVIDELVIRDARVQMALSMPGLAPLQRELALPEIRLEDVGEHSKGQTISQLVGIVLEAVLRSALEHGWEHLPKEVLADLSHTLDELPSVLGEAASGAFGEAAGQIGEELGKILKKKD